ncbi:unnamed protein product [Diplocarpon coronariae]
MEFSTIHTVQHQLPILHHEVPFNIIGTINSMSLDAGGALAGGSITVDGQKIVVPKNLLATLPSITVAWGELFKDGAANLPGSISWEANVIGNRVNGQFIAGLVYIAQRSTQIVQGFITAIDPSTGHFKLNGGATGFGGTDCVINDPVGRYGRAYTANPLWTADPDSPSIHSQNGFPMCIPRGTSDPLCPSKNRPVDAAGVPLRVYTFKDPASITSTDPDARIAAPLLVGDYVEVSGTFTGGGLLEVFSLNANLQFLTAPGKKPVYLWVEEAIFGVVTTQGGENGETRAVAWTSDPTTPIQWFAMDVDACSGNVTERNLVLQQPTTKVPIGRVVYRLGKTDASPATRQVGFRATTGTTVTSNGITAGQYFQPIFSYTFPELTSFGTPVFPNLFDVIPYLAKGSGPYSPGTFGVSPPASEVLVGQLSPWPGSSAPATTSCPPRPTVAPVTTASAASTIDSTNPSSVNDIPAPDPTTAAPTTLATATSAAPASTSIVPKDIITVLSASQSSSRGVTTVACSASSNNANAKLFMAVAGPNPITATAMTKSGTTFSLSISVKGKGTSVTITNVVTPPEQTSSGNIANPQAAIKDERAPESTAMRHAGALGNKFRITRVHRKRMAFHGYISLNMEMQENKILEQRNWEHDWSNWEASPADAPSLWQYTATTSSSGDLGPSICLNESPVSTHANTSSLLPSTTNSPSGLNLPGDRRSAPSVPTPERHIGPLKRSLPQLLYINGNSKGGENEETYDAGSWGSKIPHEISTDTPLRPAHRRAKSSREFVTKDAKRAHTVVERNYRERLNDKIADLGLYLFETSSDARAKPSKSLVMTRAKERLRQLESRNKSLEAEVVKLRQHIAILDHIVASKGEPGLTTPQ